MKKGIILARVSTQEQEKTGLSIKEIQLPQLRQYALDNDIEVLPEHEFVFQETASQKFRKKFNEMVEFIKSKPDITVVIAFRVDRMTRNYRDAVEMDNLRLDFGKELHFVSDRLVLTKKVFGRVIQDWDMKVFLAKQHINRCQEDTYNTIQSKLRNNEIYGMAPYGYENFRDSNNKANVRVKQPEAEYVKKIFELYTTGVYSYLSIAQKLKREFKADLYKGKIEKIIKNPFYIGYREYEGAKYPHKYPTFVSLYTWEKAQSIREGKWQGQWKGKAIGKHGIYRGLVYCGQCGCSMTPEVHTKTQKNGNKHKWTYYHCTGNKGKHKDTWVEEKNLTEQFSQVFAHIKIPDADLEHIVKILRESHDGKKEFNAELFTEYTVQMQKLDKRIEQIYEDKLDGVIEQAQYEALRAKYRIEKNEFKMKLDKLDTIDEEYYVSASKILELASRSQELFIGSETDQKKEIIGLVFQNLFLKDGKLSYELQEPFNMIFKTSESLNWGGWLDAVLNSRILFEG